MNTLQAEALDIIKIHFVRNYSIATTSFGLTSVVMIDLISKSKLKIPIIFINTNFHFKETIEYKNKLVKFYNNLDFIEVLPKLSSDNFLTKNGFDIQKKNPELCCTKNKVEPLNEFIYKKEIKIWISALRKTQTSRRLQLKKTDNINDNLIKLYPLLNWSENNMLNYIREMNLPFHPLAFGGYGSIGCEPCTDKGECRVGRWKGLKKTECGLHF